MVERFGCAYTLGYFLNAFAFKPNPYYYPPGRIPPAIPLIDRPEDLISPGKKPAEPRDPNDDDNRDTGPFAPEEEGYDSHRDDEPQSVPDDPGSSGPPESQKDGPTGPVALTPPPDILVPRTQERNCAELIRMCKEATAAADQADQDAAKAHARADAAHQACDDAKAARAQAEADLQNARNQPDKSKSWAESEGRRVTSQDLENEKSAAKGAWEAYKSGQITGDQLQEEWKKQGDPGHIEKLRKDRVDNSAAVQAAQARLDQAIQNEKDVCGQVASADQAASDADAAAKAAHARASSCCDAAAKCQAGGG
jgi:hypothetical protein